MTTIEESPGIVAPSIAPASREIAAESSSSRGPRSLRIFFALSARFPRVMRVVRPIVIRAAVQFAPHVVNDVSANGSRITGHPVESAQARRFARAVLSNFYNVVVDMAAAARVANLHSLQDQIESVHGLPQYEATRRQRRGAVLITAHMGSFEIGLAALRGHEENVHVVFKRDPFARFESVRSHIHAMLGVHEAPIDDGLASMMKLRDALAANHVVVMQADRALAGQHSQIVPVLSGHLRLPLGPLKLARLTSSPVIPVFCIRGGDGRFQIHLLPAIEVGEDNFDDALGEIGQTIGRFIGQHSEQWLMLERAFVEDETPTNC